MKCSQCKMMAAKKRSKKDMKPGHKKFEKVMREFKEGKLHSGSKKGPKVMEMSQARAIAFSEDRKADKMMRKMKRKMKSKRT